jgi:hypothetical protein
MKLASIGMFVATLMTLAQAPARPRPAVPLDARSTILDAFKTHQVVALGEGDHGNEQGATFRLSLIRDPRFAGAVNDIVVETGNALYQDLMDRFIRGDDVPSESLRRVWQDTTQPFTTFDNPIYEEFFRTVRTVNATLPRSRQLRVLLGDPPMDWNRVTSDDRTAWNNAMAQRDSYPAGLIRREVLAARRHALVIYGGMHLQRRALDFNYETFDDPSRRDIVQALESGTSATHVFTIWTNTYADLAALQPEVVTWRKPSLALTHGSVFGAADFTFYYPFSQDRQTTRDGALVPVPRDQWRTLRMEDQFDAVLYVGPPAEITSAKLSPQLCLDQAYIKMRLSRFALMGLSRAGDRLKQECAGATLK